ncbi:hypothetical protein [Tenacibaculum sp. Bg11-29]|uniref:hypothetical protein n=1 Tax=Tenacibaculum sp. Bg11-29 TaxID=2058306 RepID=UPI0018E387C5|nr:hypothetical protein [Tenacibaculum sp. Bg11-29]
MRIDVKISLLIILILTIIGCQNSEKKEKQLIQKEYGKWRKDNDSLSVELNLKGFKNWNDLLERTEKIACNDSVPKITLQTDKGLKTIYFQNPCWKNFGCILIKQKNVIEIHNDTINKFDKNFYPLDSLKSVLKRDLENNGKNPSLCDSPEKLLIYVSYDNFETKKLLKTLNKLTQAYEQITNKTDINIWLNEMIRLEYSKIPPMPYIPEEIELIEDEI